MTALPHVIDDGPIQANFDGVERELGLKLPLASVSAYAQTLLDDVDAPTARTTLGTDAAGAQRPPSGPEATLKVIRGTVNTAGTGSIVSGSGFTITRHSTGNLTVTFTTAFASAPSGGLGTNADAVSYVTMPSTTAFRVLLRNEAAGVLGAVDAQFTFAMWGPA
jgi:hypothetical protein